MKRDYPGYLETTMEGFDKLAEECTGDCLLAEAIAGLAVGVVIVSPSQKIAWINRAAAEILGTNGDSHIGRPVQELLKDPQLAAFWEDALECAGGFAAHVTARSPEPKDLKLHASHCHNSEGEELGRALLICDVTADRKIQVEMSQAVATRLLDLTSGHMPPEPVANLTQQELRVLRLVGRGLGNDDIAKHAGISPSTVRSHLKSVYRKLGLDSRAAAVSYAIRNHLV